MENSARLFNCARCHRQVTICSDCDRGNIYCGQACSKIARKESLQAADQRYQNSQRGRLKHAARQQRYRQRQKENAEKKVTDHGSPVSPPDVLLPPEVNEPPKRVAASVTHDIHCHFCGRSCLVFLRAGFLRRGSPDEARIFASWPRGP